MVVITITESNEPMIIMSRFAVAATLTIMFVVRAERFIARADVSAAIFCCRNVAAAIVP